jgi:hypothetical protein
MRELLRNHYARVVVVAYGIEPTHPNKRAYGELSANNEGKVGS